MQAKLHTDGFVEFDGQRFASPSKAAEYARSTVTGRAMNTNGWAFWRYMDSDQKRRELVYARSHRLNGAKSR
jgi:hypothetical protein